MKHTQLKRKMIKYQHNTINHYEVNNTKVELALSRTVSVTALNGAFYEK